MEEHHRERIIVFTDVFERNEEENYELVESAKKLGAVCFKEDISKINFGFHSGKKELVFLIMGNDDSENITQSISVINSYKGKDNIRLYIFSQSEQSKLVISGVRYGYELYWNSFIPSLISKGRDTDMRKRR